MNTDSFPRLCVKDDAPYDFSVQVRQTTLYTANKFTGGGSFWEAGQNQVGSGTLREPWRIGLSVNSKMDRVTTVRFTRAQKA